MLKRIYNSISVAVFLCIFCIYQTTLLAAPPLRAYGELPGLERAAISPSGKRYALIATFNDVRSLMMMEGDKLIRRVNLGEIKVRSVEWATEDLVLVDFSQTQKLVGFTADKAEFFRTFVISTDNSAPTIVFSKQEAMMSATFGWHGIRNIEGGTFGFFGGVPLQEVPTLTGGKAYSYQGGAPALYRVNLSDLSATEISARPKEGERHDYLIDVKGNLEAKLIHFELSGKWKINDAKGTTIANGINKQGGISLIAFGPTGDTVVYAQEDETSESQSFFEVPIAGGKPKEILAGTQIERLFINRRTGVLMGYLESGADPKTHFFNPTSDNKIARIEKAFPKLNRRLVDWNPKMTNVLVTTSGNDDSGTWWTVDLVTNTANPIGFERPTIFPEDVGSISTISYKASDELEMDGILTLPVGKEPKNLPVIMLPHGGPTSHDEAAFDWWAQGLAARGYAVFQPNFRGSTNRDAAFIAAGYGEWGRKMQSDISDGLAHLVSHGIVDPKRACIVGASYGGYAALAGVTLQKGLYRCAVSVAGISDVPLMVSTDMRESGSNPVLRRNLSQEVGSGGKLKDVSPRRFAAQADAPIMLIHGKDDTVVPYKQSQLMADALKDSGKPYELVTLTREDHWLSRGETRLKMLEATVAFIEKYNPPQ